jgi:hypothetical protein
MFPGAHEIPVNRLMGETLIGLRDNIFTFPQTLRHSDTSALAPQPHLPVAILFMHAKYACYLYVFSL